MSCTTTIDAFTYSPVPAAGLVDDNFTLSYTLPTSENPLGTFVCFHDYVPDFALSLRNNRLLHFVGGGMYEHNAGLPGVYFGARKASYLAAALAPRLKDRETVLYPFVINSINWNMDVENNTIRLLEETWTTISLHNSYQGTRDILLVPFKENCDFAGQFGVANLHRIRNRWVYNYAFNEKLNSAKRTWVELKDEFITQNTEDKSCTDQELYRDYLVDDYVIAKFSFDNASGYRFYLYEINFDIDVITDGTGQHQ